VTDMWGRRSVFATGCFRPRPPDRAPRR